MEKRGQDLMGAAVVRPQSAEGSWEGAQRGADLGVDGPLGPFSSRGGGCFPSLLVPRSHCCIAHPDIYTKLFSLK